MKKTTIMDSKGDVIYISNANDISIALNRLQKQEPQIALLEIPNFGTLTFGISKNYGFVEYMPESEEPPYLFANQELLEFKGEFIEFDSGGTITPVPKNQCIPFDLVAKILIDSFVGKKLVDYINWYEES